MLPKKQPHGCHRLAVRGLLCQGGGTRPVKSLAFASVIHKLRNNKTCCLFFSWEETVLSNMLVLIVQQSLLRFVQLGPHLHRDQEPQKFSKFPAKMDL